MRLAPGSGPPKITMSHIDYALHESPVGYALFQIVHQADAVGLKLKQTQEAANDLALFGKMVKLVNFSPFRYGTENIGGTATVGTVG